MPGALRANCGTALSIKLLHPAACHMSMCTPVTDCRLAATEIQEQAHARTAAVREVQYHLTSTLFGLGTVEQVDSRMQEYNELQEACFKGTGATPQASGTVDCCEGACQACTQGSCRGLASGALAPCLMKVKALLQGRCQIMARCRSLSPGRRQARYCWN